MIKHQKNMNERMARIETSIEYIKQSLEENTKKLDRFIECADTKYATKNELEEVKIQVSKHAETSTGWVKTLLPWGVSVLSLLILIYVTFLQH
jgi:hypothetical protein